jgi:hypothetical protein
MTKTSASSKKSPTAKTGTKRKGDPPVKSGTNKNANKKTKNTPATPQQQDQTTGGPLLLLLKEMQGPKNEERISRIAIKKRLVKSQGRIGRLRR